ncbi:MAG: hypothetical protein ACRDHX_09000, partial [Chloroflexota bacterium]
SRGHAVSPDHLAVAREQAKRVLSGVFDEVWLDIGDTRYARRVAQLVAEGKPPRARQLPAQVSGDALDSLVAKGILRHAGSRYSFVEPFFEDYVRTKQG